MTTPTTIHLDPGRVIGSVHQHLYGANLEHIGRSVYQGVWAEMLKSRKFAGDDRMYIGLSEGLSHQNPNFGIIEPWTAVNPDYQGVLFVHDNTTFYSGAQAQRVTIRQADDQPHGIEQGGLTLEAGRDYRIRLVLKGEGQAVTVRLGDQTWVIEAVPGEWTTFQQTLRPQNTSSEGVFQITARAKGHVWIGAASLMPADHLDGHRADVVAALREWQPTFMRWPGGNFVSAYHWMDGLGDPDKRPSYFDPAWKVWETHDVGTDEFMRLCHLVGSEPILTVNMGNGTPEEAAGWVEYCNGGPDTHYGAMRAANGHPDPYNVKTWFVGNEQFGNWQVGHCDAETYARRYLDFARAMRAVDPDLHLIGVGAPTDLYGHWNELVLQGAGAEMDALSVHYYSIRTEKWDVPPPASQLYLPKVASAHELALMLDRTLEIVSRHSNPPVPLAFDEWNTYVAGKAPDFFEEYSIADALYTGALMNACLKRCDRIQMSGIYNLINVMGNYRVTPTLIWKTPSSLVLELFTHYRGEEGIFCSADSPTMATPAAGNLPAFADMPVVDAAATYDAAQKLIYLSVVNRDSQAAAALTVTGITRTGDSVIHYIAGDHPLALNNEDNPQAVRIEGMTWAAGEETLTIPAHSVALVVISIT